MKDRKPPRRPEQLSTEARQRRDEQRALDMDARLRAALASPPVRGALIVESDASLCADLQVALAPLGVFTVWATGDMWPALIAAPAAVVVFGERTARLRDFAAPRRLRHVAPSLPLVVVARGPLSRDRAALFDAVLASPAEVRAACERLTMART